MNSIFLAYSGVHQIFQLAAAAEEMGELQTLICSFANAPGKWGSYASGVMTLPRLNELGDLRIPRSKILEYPWPKIWQTILSKAGSKEALKDYSICNNWFDHVSSKLLQQSKVKLAVFAETCAARSLLTAKSKGIISILEIAGIPSWFLTQSIAKAAEEYSLPCPVSLDSSELLERKKTEISLADHLLVCSELQKDIILKTGVTPDKVSVIPLWSQLPSSNLLLCSQRQRRLNGRLRVAYGGAISLSKGIPYLLKAINLLGEQIDLTLVGSMEPLMAPLLNKLVPNAKVHPYLPKKDFLAILASHDVLVLPSLGDSFGFVALEAMAQGLPVLVTDHCGVPVPDASWRVPALSSDAIAARLEHYCQFPNELCNDGEIAMKFAAKFTGQVYRQNAQQLYRRLLAA
ncbi:MAG: glycosyltransferase family 4 protein [Nitrospira sp.]